MTNAPLKANDFFTILREAALAFGQDKAPRLAAAIAYYAMFSIAPLLLFAVAIAGRFLTDQTVIDRLFGPDGMISQNLGADAATFLKTIVPKTDALHKGTLVATIIGFVTLFLGATGLFVQLQDALNSMWGADPAPPQGIVNIVKTRVISFAMILVIGLILLVFLGLNTYLSAIAQHLGDQIGVGAFAVRLLTFCLSTLFLTPVFAGIFKLLPAVKLEWREVWVGAGVTALLFTIGQLLIGVYFGRTAPGSAFGASAALVVLLTWIYYSAMIFFFGAEVTWVYSQHHGTRAGGAANSAKKQALNAAGAHIDPTPGAQEQEALAAADQPIKDSRGRVLGLPADSQLSQGLSRGLDRGREQLGRLQAPSRAEGRLLPSIGGAVLNAVMAVLAVPAVIVLRVLGLTGGKKRK